MPRTFNDRQANSKVAAQFATYYERIDGELRLNSKESALCRFAYRSHPYEEQPSTTTAAVTAPTRVVVGDAEANVLNEAAYTATLSDWEFLRDRLRTDDFRFNTMHVTVDTTKFTTHSRHILVTSQVKRQIFGWGITYKRLHVLLDTPAHGEKDTSSLWGYALPRESAFLGKSGEKAATYAQSFRKPRVQDVEIEYIALANMTGESIED